MIFEDPPFTVRRGDSIADVREKLDLTAEPQSFFDNGIEKYVYRFEKHGFWIFFNENGIVYSIRFEKPYASAIEGIHIGDSKDQVMNVLGKAHRYLPIPGKNRWIYDRPDFFRVDFDDETEKVEKIFR